MIFFKKSGIEKPENMGSFERVSYDQFEKDWKKLYGNGINNKHIRDIYHNIKLPERSTDKSAGYDFIAPFGFTLEKGANIIIPTGIRVFINPNGYLDLNPRSGMGFKYRTMLANTRGIIDADYCEAENEGHIMVKLCYEGIEESSSLKLELVSDSNNFMFNCIRPEYTESKPLVINQGDKFVQGIFNVYGITKDDKTSGKKRTGGMGSTGK